MQQAITGHIYYLLLGMFDIAPPSLQMRAAFSFAHRMTVLHMILKYRQTYWLHRVLVAYILYLEKV